MNHNNTYNNHQLCYSANPGTHEQGKVRKVAEKFKAEK